MANCMKVYNGEIVYGLHICVDASDVLMQVSSCRIRNDNTTRVTQRLLHLSSLDLPNFDVGIEKKSAVLYSGPIRSVERRALTISGRLKETLVGTCLTQGVRPVPQLGSK